jgi:hydroxymethylglutaryl-CoA lyase
MIRIVEVGPRDGLQNEPGVIATDAKVAFVDALSAAGLAEIEVSAFVSPRWIPQLADAEDVFRRIRRRPGTLYSALVPNEKGLERALRAEAGKIAVFTAASETFTGKNIHASIAESIVRFGPVVEKARQVRLPVRGYVSTAFWCPYEGKMNPAKVVDVILRLIDLGVDDISVGDTIGKAVPAEVRALLEVLLPRVPARRLAMHFHDTYGHALENVVESLSWGIEVFDSSTGGIGGCPYAPGASGNVSTESVLRMLAARGVETGVRLDAIEKAGTQIAASLGRKHGSHS